MPRGVRAVQTPGVDPQTEGDEPQDQAEQPAPAVAPDLAALVQMEVAKVLARKAASEKAAKPEELPTEAEAMKMVMADPNRRSVLSRTGWVAAAKPHETGRV